MGKVYDKLKNFLPGAKNMNKLNWDCNLEEIAYQAMGGKCATLDLLTFPYVPLQVQLDTNKCRNVTSQMKLNLFGWWTEVEHYDMKNKTKYDDERIRDFAQMAYGAATGFGCTYDACKPKTKFVCLFSTKCVYLSALHVQMTILICSFCNYFLSIYINMDIYDPTWTESEICNACAANCTDRLCPQTPYTPVTINATCKDDKLTQDSNNAALWMHNYYRKLLASGWAKDPKSKSGYAPPGKQMKALEYDCSNATGTSVAEQTYKAIENCQQTGTPNATPGYSMNFLRINDHKISEQDALKQAIKTWWGELEKKGLGSDTTFHDNSGITSFANMANDQVDKVACAVRNCQRTGQTLVMCQYNSYVFINALVVAEASI
ncbi:hypothetical protein Y032_0151g2841 [Ancylostoma ceylanicum]|uniref:SCP domain-containing protein n=1 Tax=Ancylostoma ceylanicum TaxID=53326 RepID=A0A016T052_9BILA|nr:hypothetical protein Y032_0151g2841 [Ancylostoma ceylanicum]